MTYLRSWIEVCTLSQTCCVVHSSQACPTKMCRIGSASTCAQVSGWLRSVLIQTPPNVLQREPNPDCDAINWNSIPCCICRAAKMCCVVSCSSLCCKSPARPLHLFPARRSYEALQARVHCFSQPCSKCGAVCSSKAASVELKGKKDTLVRDAAQPICDKVQSVIQLPSALVTV